MEKTIPASAGLINSLPLLDGSADGSVVRDASVFVDSKKKSTLPPGYDTVPGLLKKIEESNLSVDTGEKASTKDEVRSSEGMTPSERAKVKVVEERKDIEEKAKFDVSKVQRKVDEWNRTKEAAKKAVENVENNLIAGGVNTDTVTEKVANLSSTEDDGGMAGVSEMYNRDGGDADTSGKKKLQRLLGKGDFDPDKVIGGDVIDDSVFKKQDRQITSPKSPSTVLPNSGEKFWGDSRGGGKSDGWSQKVRGESNAVGISSNESPMANGGSAEVDALKAELESQMRWEAVRLQEAVRSQMVEDKKIAARDAAEAEKRHGEELARVREEVLAAAEKAWKQKTTEIQKKAAESRDEDVLRMLKKKEAEIREAIAVEYTDKERGESLERNKQLFEAKAAIETLMSRFDAVVAQTERAKEAARRTSSAFMLGEILALSRPLEEQLSEASGKSELGKLVAESIPENAMKRGVSSFERLKEDFGFASQRGLSVAMVPEGRAGTIWGHMLGAIFSRLKIPVDSREDESTLTPRTNEERIRRAELLVKEGDLSGAIVTLEGLNGLSADVMRDWVGAAKARVAAELAGRVLVADAIISQIALLGGEIAGK